MCTVLLPPGDNPIAVNKYINISINVFKSTAIIFARAGRRFIQSRPVALFGEPIQWVETTRYLGITLDTRLIWCPTSIRSERKLLKRRACRVPSWIGRVELYVRNGVLLYKQLIRPMMDYACSAWSSAAHTHVRRLQVLESKCLRLTTDAPWYVRGRYTRIWVFHCLPPTSEPWLRSLTQS